MATLDIEKYGEWITVDGKKYLLTNYRAVVTDFEKFGDMGVDLRKRFNTAEECEIIKEYFKVFNFKVDLSTRSQMVRHRCSWQELSRRYVSGERVPFEFYISDKMKGLESEHDDYYMDGMSDFETDFTNTHSTEELVKRCVEHYRQALEQGVKPQEARRIIPQCAYTQIWGAFMPKHLDNYFKLRLDKTAQWEIQQTAVAMQELIEKENTNGI